MNGSSCCTISKVGQDMYTTDFHETHSCFTANSEHPKCPKWPKSVKKNRKDGQKYIYRPFANYIYHGTDCDKTVLNGILSKSLIRNFTIICQKLNYGYIYIYIYIYIHIPWCNVDCNVQVAIKSYIYIYIQGVPGGMCQTSGGCSLC